MVALHGVELGSEGITMPVQLGQFVVTVSHHYPSFFHTWMHAITVSPVKFLLFARVFG